MTRTQRHMRWVGPVSMTSMILLGGLGACGGGSDIMSGDGLPFGGRDIRFQSYYAYFPTDFAVTIVRDTLPYDQACELLKKYGKVPVASPVDHYGLVITIQSATAGDDVTVDLNDRGPAGDMRLVGLGLYPPGAYTVPAGGFGVDAGGTVRLTALTHYQHVAGSYNIKFRTGETSMGSFDINACPK